MPTEEQRRRNHEKYLKYRDYYLRWAAERDKRLKGEPGSEQREKYKRERQKKRPEYEAQYREKTNARQRARRRERLAADPERQRMKERERARRRVEAIRSDPVSYAKFLEYARESGRRHRNKKIAANPNWMREEVTLRRYGLTPQAFADMLKAQGGGCAICHLTLDFATKTTVPHIDHDHATGEVRGILCLKCNTGLGAFGDKPSLLSEAVLYLEKRLACQSRA